MKTLLEDILEGSQDAFRVFYDMTYPDVFRFVKYFLPHKEDYEEVISEVFYIIWKQRATLPSIQNMKAWIYTICRNEAYHYVKKSNHILSIEEMPVELLIDATEVDTEIIEEEMLSVYNQALAELPERCKLIFVMVRDERMKYKDIAETLSITEGTVAQQMNHAIHKIATAVARHYPSLMRKYKKSNNSEKK
ncbi:DNA-directed RNA polymerase sigma-70 factor [Bacteroidia bacterium]|nr:DNA-directed RNA polymerase sigma-70 factor [Bacteroidia bacterium]